MAEKCQSQQDYNNKKKRNAESEVAPPSKRRKMTPNKPTVKVLVRFEPTQEVLFKNLFVRVDANSAIYYDEAAREIRQSKNIRMKRVKQLQSMHLSKEKYPFSANEDGKFRQYFAETDRRLNNDWLLPNHRPIKLVAAIRKGKFHEGVFTEVFGLAVRYMTDRASLTYADCEMLKTFAENSEYCIFHKIAAIKSAVLTDDVKLLLEFYARCTGSVHLC